MERQALVNYAIWFNSSVLFAGSSDGPNVPSAKEVYAKVILFVMREAIKRGLSKPIFLSDTLEVIQANNKNYD